MLANLFSSIQTSWLLPLNSVFLTFLEFIFFCLIIGACL
uniref:Uncharacterized protein n=1 Tax=Arundo donax TaxID=35708 RepID=A0A0A9BXC6_ARUDO